MGYMALRTLTELLLNLQVGSGVATVGPGCAEPSPVPQSPIRAAFDPAAQLLFTCPKRNEHHARITPAGHQIFTIQNLKILCLHVFALI